MKIINIIIEKAVVLCLALCFMFVSTYVPQPWVEIKKAEAGGGAAGGGATEWTQIANNVQLGAVNAATTASAGFDSLTSFATGAEWMKSSVLDGIGWALAKNLLSQMTASVVNWINSGFEGSPAFVQDLEGFLINAGDEVFGQYLEELGGPLSFLCSPFELDVRIALATTYTRARSGQPATESCRLSGALANIEDFTNGDFTQGGWESWFQITSAPETYTPYGSLLTAQSEAGIAILNKKTGERTVLGYGSGFLSSKICEVVEGSGVSQENCFISTPGKVIEDALTFQLSTGPQSLIAADEINEIISALFGQLQKQAITGAAGLLGLSGGTGYTRTGFDGGSYINQMAEEALTSDPVHLRSLMESALTTELAYQDAANNYLPQLNAYYANILNRADRRANAQEAADEIPPLLARINANIATLDSIISRYDALPAPEADTSTSSAQRASLMQEYTNLRGLHTDAQVRGSEIRWQSLIR